MLLETWMHTSSLVRYLLLLLCSVLFVSCAAGSSQQQTHQNVPHYSPIINSLVATTGCGHPSPIAQGNSDFQTIAADPAKAEGSQTRTYRIYIPSMYQDQQQLPVVLVFHGYGGRSYEIEEITGFSDLAEQQHFIVVYPDGLEDGHNNAQFWANGGAADSYGIDDVQFVSDVLNDVQRKFCVDAHRIYATGFSNGGGMTDFLACRLAMRIAAFAPVSGNFLPTPGGCHPGRPVSILEIHGTADTTVPYNGDSSSPNHPPGSEEAIPAWLHNWAVRDGCTRGLEPFLQTASFIAEQWTGCQGHVAVVHYRIEGGGHIWPDAIGDQTCASVIWKFFQNYS